LRAQSSTRRRGRTRFGFAIIFPALLCSTLALSVFGLTFSHFLDINNGIGSIRYLGQSPVSKVVANVAAPAALAFSPENGNILVASSSYQMITILKHGTYQDVLNVSLGETPLTIAWDSLDGTIYTSTMQGNVISLDGDTFATMGSASISSPVGMFYDSVRNRVYVASSSSNAIYIINASSTTILNTINLCCSPSSVVYYSGNGYLYATESSSNNVAVVNPVNGSVIASITVGSDPQSIINEGHFLYVTNYNSNSISVIDGQTNTVSETITNVGLNPDSIAYNTYNGCYYVADYGSSSVSQICSGSLVSTISVGSEPDAITYDPSQYSILVANFGSGTISEIPTAGAPSLPTTSSSTSQVGSSSISQSGSSNSSTENISTASSASAASAGNSSSASGVNTSILGMPASYVALIVIIAVVLPEIGVLVYFMKKGNI
jgi:YVTN family beta-propeller protein